MRASITRTILVAYVGAAATWWAGCSGSDFGTNVDLPREKHHRLPPTLKPGTVITLPAAQPFNVHDKLWNSTPGQGGKAAPAADASANGTAFCKADGADGGSSFAEFQIGHCIDNDSGVPVEAELRMLIDYDQACQAEGQGAKTASNYAIKAFVKDTAGRIVRNLPLATHTSDDGQVHWSGAERTITDVTMQPGLGYYIVLAGRAEAGSQTGTSSSASITVKAFQLEIRCKPAPATAPASSQPSATRGS